MYASLKEGIIGNIYVKFMKFRPVVQKMLFEDFLSGALATLLFSGA